MLRYMNLLKTLEKPHMIYALQDELAIRCEEAQIPAGGQIHEISLEL
jgi:hypothetical protein